MKISTFHNSKFIANAVTMGLYNRSAMAAILDMQISKFSNLKQDNPTKRVQKRKKNSENQMNIDDCRAFTLLLNMQISP